MRAVGAVLVFGACVSAFGQGVAKSAADEAKAFFQSVRPDAAIVVKKHKTGVDTVEITMRDAGYPPELLREQIQAIASRVGTLRGSQVYRQTFDASNADASFVKGLFAVDGLLDRENGRVRINAIAQGLAGAPAPHTLGGLSIIVEGEQPTPNTLRRFRSPAVEVEGMPQTSPVAIEYRVRLLTQDPEKIDIPDRVEPNGQPSPTPSRYSGPDALTIGLVAAAVIAAGALVYLLLLRGRPRRS